MGKTIEGVGDEEELVSTTLSRRLWLTAAMTLLAASASGCANVAAYERGKLAHPTMAPSDATSVARDHVYAIQEGAMGGTIGAASGCGCN